jgi:type II secretory pathway pseudopilin PulG
MRLQHLATHRRRSGAVLIVVLVIIAVLGALAAGSFFAALHEERIDSAAIVRARALAAAEHAAYTIISPQRWQAAWSSALPVRRVGSDSEQLAGGATATTQVWALTPYSALVIAEGVAGLPPRDARRRVSVLVSLQRPRMPAAAAIAFGGLSVVEGSSIAGGTGGGVGDCLTPDSDVAAVSVPPRVAIDTAECSPLPCLRAAGVIRDTVLAARPETPEQFGQVDRSFLASVGRQFAPGADLSPAPVIGADGACDPNAAANLGDPLRVLGPDSPCAMFFPVVHAEGDLQLTGGAGQGMLVVEGNLTLLAGARFTGVMLVRGSARFEDGARLDGIVLADRVSLAGASEIQYSACAVEHASRAAARPFPELTHSWAEMF